MRTIQQASSNYTASVDLVPERYKQGITAADWASKANAPEAQQNWSTGVQRAASEGRYAAGVSRVSNEQWKQAALTKGANSIAAGMQMGAEKYARRFAPILQAMQNAVQSLPARSADANANIDARLKPVVAAAQAAARGNNA